LANSVHALVYITFFCMECTTTPLQNVKIISTFDNHGRPISNADGSGVAAAINVTTTSSPSTSSSTVQLGKPRMQH
jgi:hypothetical protein